MEKAKTDKRDNVSTCLADCLVAKDCKQQQQKGLGNEKRKCRNIYLFVPNKDGAFEPRTPNYRLK